MRGPAVYRGRVSRDRRVIEHGVDDAGAVETGDHRHPSGTVEGLNRRTSCIQRAYSSTCARPIASGCPIVFEAPGEEDPQVRLQMRPRDSGVAAKVGNTPHRSVTDSGDGAERGQRFWATI
jgi:hypothetical protein